MLRQAALVLRNVRPSDQPYNSVTRARPIPFPIHPTISIALPLATRFRVECVARVNPSRSYNLRKPSISGALTAVSATKPATDGIVALELEGRHRRTLH